MRVFVTGASGHIGSAVVAELLDADHEVVGLARSETSAAAVRAAGAEVVRADLDDLSALRDAAVAADGVIHLAFKHDLMRTGGFADAVAADLRAVETLGEALAGSDRPFVIASGTLMLAFSGITGRAGTELDVLAGGPRADAENAVIALGARGVRSSVVRLPPLVHGTLDHHGFGPTLIGIARTTGFSGYPGEGSNRWPGAHTLDVARVFRLALEMAPAGSRLHAVGDEGVPLRQIAEVIGRQLNLPVTSVASDDSAHFSFLAPFVSLDNPTSSALTQDLLGWKPRHPGLIEDLEADHYFATPTP